MPAKVLLKGELEALLRVPTTVRQAEKILERNRKALRALKAGSRSTIRIGCPHCLDAADGLGRMRCGHCVYHDGMSYAMSCLDFQFGGYDANDVRSVIKLYMDKIVVDGAMLAHPAAVVWLKGHIEWAQEVIKRAKKGARR